MKVSILASFILLIVILILAIFIGERDINSRIEETIQSNYLTEINSLKDKLNKQSELINSIIDLKDKDNSVDKEIDKVENNNSVSEEISEFEYVKENGGITIVKYIGKQTSVNIPNKIEQLPILKIGENAFSETNVKSVSIPSSCEEIDWFAFYGCFALTTVYVSSNVDTIGYGAFDGCSKALTIYCDSDSFAEKYAQSFGISYSNYQ